MATRTKKSTTEAADQNSNESVSAATNSNNGQNDRQSQLATVLVGLLIIASGLLIYNYFQRSNAPDTTSQTEQQQEEDKNEQANKNSQEDGSDADTQEKEGQYTVESGDSLWSIAEKVYGNGFDWTKIRDANNLGAGANVEVGQVLTIPDSAAVAQQPAGDTSTIATNTESDVAGVQELRETPSTAIQTHTVQHGETLWSIAENAYGDGHKWDVIYNDPHNQIGLLPDGSPLVHSGNVLYIPDLP